MAAALVSLAFGYSQPAVAASGEFESPEQLAKRSERIVHGVVDELEVFEPKPGFIATRVGFTNVTVWKGAQAARFQLTVAGGILGDRKVSVSGQPEFRLGEEWLVFTLLNPVGQSILAHPLLGAIPVRRENGKAVVSVGAESPREKSKSDVVSLESLHGRIGNALR